MRRPAAFLLAGLPLLGCRGGAGTIDPPEPRHAQSFQLRGERRGLAMFTAGDAASPAWTAVEASVRGLLGEAAGGTAVAGIAAECGADAAAIARRPPTGGGPQPAFAAAALAAPLVGAAIEFAAGAIKRDIDRWAASYEATWSARYVANFYARPPGDDLANLRLTHPCFAVTRTVGGDAAPRLVFLHVGRLMPSADQTALRVVPLFHAHTGTKARVGQGGTFNAALVLTVEAVWTDLRSGVNATRNTVFTTTLDLGQQDLDAPRRGLVTGAAREGMASGWFPLVPVSIDQQAKLIGQGPVTITATVAETAAARDLAAAAARQADGLVDQIAASVREAVTAQLPQR